MLQFANPTKTFFPATIAVGLCFLVGNFYLLHAIDVS